MAQSKARSPRYQESEIDLTSMFLERIMSLGDDVKSSYLKAEVFSKFVSINTDPPELRRNRAIMKWLSVEKDNEATNDRLIFTPADYNILPRVPFRVFMDWCAAHVRSIIGDVPPVDSLIGSFSGGASTSRSRTCSHPAGKYVGEAHATSRCLEWFPLLSEELPTWLGLNDHLSLKVVPGNVLFTVPKKTDIDRVACKEPDLNMFIQKGVGLYFRRALRRTGINLNDQSKNRSLAQKGSRDGSLSTLDLTSASDSVSQELVFQFLPEIWYTLLDSIRSPVTIIDGEEHRNHMFSSMGNGFTFELESLLFLTITRAVAYFTGTKGIISIYGDDIICPTGISDKLIFVLGYLGFSVNTEKSFVSGPFRESCGGHYHNGYDVTPFYVKAPIVGYPATIDVANKLRKWGEMGLSKSRGLCDIVDEDIEPIWLWLKSCVPSYLWGGEDTSFKYQLVSNDTPTFRIQEETNSKETGLGGYLQWLNATWDRTNEIKDGVITSRHSRAKGRFVLKRVRNSAVPRLQGYFLSEI